METYEKFGQELKAVLHEARGLEYKNTLRSNGKPSHFLKDILHK